MGLAHFAFDGSAEWALAHSLTRYGMGPSPFPEEVRNGP